MRFALIVSLVLLSWGAHAQNPDSNKPLEITADQSLEWNRAELFFKARKNVVAKQGQTSLLASVLTAKYREAEESGIDIYSIQALGSVRIYSQNSKVYGDKAIYDLDRGYAVMTGNDLRLVSDDQTVHARDKFEYWVADGRLEAHGNAYAKRDGDKIEADKMIAIFINDPKTGKRTLKSLEALGHVVITTPDEILKGNRAIYMAKTNIAELIDGVVIVRGPNKLQGSRAEVNLNTNISKIFGGDGDDGGRVRGVFYPNEFKENQ